MYLEVRNHVLVDDMRVRSNSSGSTDVNNFEEKNGDGSSGTEKVNIVKEAESFQKACWTKGTKKVGQDELFALSVWRLRRGKRRGGFCGQHHRRKRSSFASLYLDVNEGNASKSQQFRSWASGRRWNDDMHTAWKRRIFQATSWS